MTLNPKPMFFIGFPDFQTVEFTPKLYSDPLAPSIPSERQARSDRVAFLEARGWKVNSI